MCPNFKDHLLRWCHNGIKCFYILVAIICGLSFLAWLNCFNQSYCPDSNYQYMYKIQRNPEVYVCCKYNYPPIGPNQCHDAPTHTCDGFITLMCIFITTLLIMCIPLICKYVISKYSESRESELQDRLLTSEHSVNMS